MSCKLIKRLETEHHREVLIRADSKRKSKESACFRDRPLVNILLQTPTGNYNVLLPS